MTPLGINTSLPTAPPCLDACLEFVDANVLQNGRHGSLNVLYGSKMLSFQARLETREQEEVRR